MTAKNDVIGSFETNEIERNKKFVNVEKELSL